MLNGTDKQIDGQYKIGGITNDESNKSSLPIQCEYKGFL